MGLLIGPELMIIIIIVEVDIRGWATHDVTRALRFPCTVMKRLIFAGGV